ncbi:hypothetical protein SMICM17S_05861 [Streptomyces microflavus]
MSKASAPASIGTTPRPNSWNAARPRSPASHHSWRSTGRYRSTAMSPVRIRSISASVEAAAHHAQAASRPCRLQTYAQRQGQVRNPPTRGLGPRGPRKVRETALALGIPKTTPDLTASPSIALGPATASVLDLTEAYATLANHGRHSAYTLVEKITKDGTEIELPDRKTEQTVTREAADTTTALLRSVVEGGTGSAAQAAGRPAVGKTGTAEEDKAAWFAGYTPDLATVVAVMGQDPESGVQTPLYGALGLDRVNGGGVPAETWAAYTEAALRSSPAQEFDLETAPGSDEPQEPGDEETGTTEPVTPDDSPTGTSPSAPTATTPSAPASSTPPSSDTGTGATGGTTGGTDGGTTGDTGDGGTGDDTGGGTGGGTDDGGTGALGGGFIEGVRGTRDPAG